MSNTVIVTGSLGQLGSYISELLISKGYEVIGTTRRRSNPNYENVAKILEHPNFKIVTCDITDYSSVRNLLMTYNPSEVYNTAAQSYVAESFKSPFECFNSDTIGVLNFLEVMRNERLTCKLLQSCTSEMFGKAFSQRAILNGKQQTIMFYNEQNELIREFIVPDTKLTEDNYPEMEKYQDELTELKPQSPYGISKLAAYHLVRLYRDSYGLNCCSAIMFNNESPRRGKEFVTRKITDYVGQLFAHYTKNGNSKNFYKLKLGNLDASRDWSFSGDMANAQYLMLQQEKLTEYVFGSEETHTVREFCEIAFNLAGFDYKDYVEVDQQFFRPSEVDFLKCDCFKAKKELGWSPKVKFDELIREMVNEDIKRYGC